MIPGFLVYHLFSETLIEYSLLTGKSSGFCGGQVEPDRYFYRAVYLPLAGIS